MKLFKYIFLFLFIISCNNENNSLLEKINNKKIITSKYSKSIKPNIQNQLNDLFNKKKYTVYKNLFQKNFKTLKSNNYILLEYSQLLFNQKNYNESLKFLNLGLNQIKNNNLKVKYFILKGKIYNSLKYIDKAQIMFEKAYDLSKHNKDIIFNLSKIYDYKHINLIKKIELFQNLLDFKLDFK